MFIKVSTVHPFFTHVIGQILLISNFGTSEAGKYTIELVGVYPETLSRPSQEINVEINLKGAETTFDPLANTVAVD